MSKREDIVAFVEVRMGTIAVANGFRTDLGAHVTTWKPNVFRSTEPALNIRDVTEFQEELPSQQWTRRMMLEVDIVIPNAGTNAPLVVRDAFADIEDVLRADRHLGNLAFYVRPVKNEIDVAQADKLVGAGQASYEIQYRTTAFNPDV